ncbi:MAG: hypothetical protein KGH84_06615 [Paracoccaceae bacterium]|nr:hypothetical protein [Paracoccaceae bacterium]
MRAWLRPPRRVLLLLVASALALVAPMLRAGDLARPLGLPGVEQVTTR